MIELQGDCADNFWRESCLNIPYGKCSECQIRSMKVDYEALTMPCATESCGSFTAALHAVGYIQFSSGYRSLREADTQTLVPSLYLHGISHKRIVCIV